MEVQDPIQVPSLTKSEEIWGTGLPSPFLCREISHLVLLDPDPFGLSHKKITKNGGRGVLTTEFPVFFLVRRLDPARVNLLEGKEMF